jgi:putative DNA primase/helicase
MVHHDLATGPPPDLFDDDDAEEVPPSRESSVRGLARAALPRNVDPQTDLANAARLVAMHGEDLRFVPSWGRWLVWDGSRWADDDACRVPGMCAEVSRAVMREATDALRASGGSKAAEGFYRFAKASQDARRLASMQTLARGLPGVSVDHSKLDPDPWALNVANGILDLRTGELMPHDRAALVTKMAGAEYDPAATCPRWDAFLRRAMGGNDALVGYLQRLVGYSLTGIIGEHVLAFLEGSGANGKSTFVNVVFGLLGSYACRAPRGLLFREQNAKHETGLTVLHGARFATCAEIDEGASFDEALVKDLTGGDPIAARRMREDFWTFQPTHKLWIAGNHRPRVRGADDGIWRRIRLVPWAVTVPEHERDPNLPAALRDELPGILAWAVRGCLEWQRAGLSEPETVREATAAYRAESDTFGQFLRERCVLESGARVARKELREEYEEWSREIGAHPLGARSLAERLRQLNVKSGSVRLGTKPVDGWVGVRLRSAYDRGTE